MHTQNIGKNFKDEGRWLPTSKKSGRTSKKDIEENLVIILISYVILHIFI